MKRKSKPSIAKRILVTIQDVFSVIKNPAVVAVSTIVAALFALVFAFTAHGLFLLDVIAGLILKAFIIHKAVRVTKHKRSGRRKPVLKVTTSPQVWEEKI